MPPTIDEGWYDEEMAEAAREEDDEDDLDINPKRRKQ